MLVDWSFGRYITDLRIIDNLLLISLGSVKQNAMCQSFLLLVAEDLCVIDILPLAEVQKRCDKENVVDAFSIDSIPCQLALALRTTSDVGSSAGLSFLSPTNTP